MPNVANTSRPQPPWDSLALALQPRGEGLQGMLDALALSTTAMPGVGDVAGLAADGYRFATDPSSRTWGNAGWASLGLIPFVPAMGAMTRSADEIKGSLRELRNKYPSVDLSLSGDADRIAINKIVVPKDRQNRGIGTQILNEIGDLADEVGIPVGLSPSAAFGGQKTRLERWYKRLGYVPNKGRNADYSVSESLIRHPAKTP